MKIARKFVILLALVAMSLAAAQAEKRTMDAEEMRLPREEDEAGSEAMESLESDHEARSEGRKMGFRRGRWGGGWGWGGYGGWGGGWGYPYGYGSYYGGWGYPYGGYGYGRFLKRE